MGCALHAERRLDSLQTLMIYRKTTHSKCVCVCQKKKIKRSSRAETRNSWLPRANGHVKLAGEGSGVRPSDRIQQDTEERERKTQQWSSRRDGTNQILQNHSKNKMIWKQSMIPGVSLEASFAVITFKKGKFNCTCHSKAYCQSHSKRLTLSGGNTVHWTYCKNVEWIIKKVGWIIIGTLMSIGNYHGHGPVLPSAVFWTTFHLKDTCGPERDWQRSKHRSGPNTYGQKVVRLCRKQLNEEEASNEQSAMPCKLKNHQYKDPVANPPTEKTHTHRRRWRVYDKAFGRDSIKKSQRSHCGEGGSTRRVTAILCTSSFSCPKRWKFWMRKQQWIRNGRNWQRFRRKPATMFGRSQGITFIVVTLNQELSSMCRKMTSQYHCDTLTWSGEKKQVLSWTCCWKAVLTILGTLVVTGIHRSFGPVSRSSKKHLQTDTCGPEGGWQKFKQHQGLIVYGQGFGQEWRKKN